ncbi:MAG TPA: hypothetical protein VGT44_13850 [Ktedonobacteraceae bacterium]|nr:hypothetical protein [Ktedonobacteraceae bacterium]
MMELLILIALLGMLVVAAVLWGANSAETIDSPEWEKRHNRGLNI